MQRVECLRPSKTLNDEIRGGAGIVKEGVALDVVERTLGGIFGSWGAVQEVTEFFHGRRVAGGGEFGQWADVSVGFWTNLGRCGSMVKSRYWLWRASTFLVPSFAAISFPLQNISSRTQRHCRFWVSEADCRIAITFSQSCLIIPEVLIHDLASRPHKGCDYVGSLGSVSACKGRGFLMVWCESYSSPPTGNLYRHVGGHKQHCLPSTGIGD